jgi:YihY family inner membrane protein
VKKKVRSSLSILKLATKSFFLIDGGQRSAAFAFYAFFSLFPMIVIFVTIGSAFFDPDKASQSLFAYLGNYVPLSEDMKNHLFKAIYGVIKSHKHVGVIAFLGLVWGASRFLASLVQTINIAWGDRMYDWWKLPLKSLTLLGLLFNAVFLGIIVPILARITKEWIFPSSEFFSWAYSLFVFFIPSLILFFSLMMFYKLAPLRKVRLRDTWLASLLVSLMFLGAQSVFVFFMGNFSSVNVVYGTFAEIIAFLLWIYLSGYIFIFGACLCSAIGGVKAKLNSIVGA